jgi:tetratricopeptide (TPR) repeat protein
MLWRCYQDWRERRQAMRELANGQRLEEAFLLDQDLNPLNISKICLDSGDTVKAAAQWDQARLLLPNAILKAPESLEILLGLKRYGEAEALMQERKRRFPRDRVYLTGLARIAEARGDIAEALKQWEHVRDTSRDSPAGYVGCGNCLEVLGRLDEAEVQFDRAIQRAPDKLHGWLGRARISDLRQDWQESLKRWKLMADRFGFEPGFAGYARVLGELGRLQEAEEYLEEAAKLYPRNLVIGATRAHLAQRRGDLEVACERWAYVRAIAPYFSGGYLEGAHRLFEAKRHAEADDVLWRATERFPGETWPLADLARFAQRRGARDEAILRWHRLCAGFPEQSQSYSAEIDALKAAIQAGEASRDSV